MNIDFYLYEKFSKEDSNPLIPKDILEQYRKIEKPKTRSLEIKESKESKGSKEYRIGDGFLAYMNAIVVKEENGQAQEQGQKLLTFFGNENIREILDYLDRYARQHQDAATPIHDACLFQLPIHQENWTTLTIWRKLARKFNYEKWFMDLLSQARDIEKDPKFNDQIKRETLLQITAGLIYTPDLVERDPEAAKLFMKYKVDKEIFEKYLELKFVDDGSLPDIKLDVYLDEKKGVTILSASESKLGEHKKTKKAYTIEKLSSKMEAALLGHFTGCCQHLGGEGRRCTIYGITDPKSGFYVIRNSKGEIVAQTWAWQTETGILVFDSIECNEAVFRDKGYLLSHLFRELAEQIVRASGTKIKEVRVGTGGNTPKKCGINLSIPRQPVSPPSYDGYRDSDRQRQLTVSLIDLCAELKLEKDSSEEDIYQAGVKTTEQWVVFFYYFITRVDHSKWRDLINKLPIEIIKTTDLPLILNVLPPDQRSVACQVSKDKSLNIIKTTEDLKDILKDFKGKLSNIIKTADDVRSLFGHFSRNECAVIYQDFKDRLLVIINTVHGFCSLVNYFHPDQRTVFYQDFKNKLLNIVKTADDFYSLYHGIPLNHRAELCQTFQDKFQNIIQTPDDFKKVQDFLPQAQRTVVYEGLKDKLPSLIKTDYNLQLICCYLSPEQKAKILQGIVENFYQLKSVLEDAGWPDGEGIDDIFEIFMELKGTEKLTMQFVGEKLDQYFKIEEFQAWRANRPLRSVPDLIKYIKQWSAPPQMESKEEKDHQTKNPGLFGNSRSNEKVDGVTNTIVASR